jgi:hypothetical protein
VKQRIIRKTGNAVQIRTTVPAFLVMAVPLVVVLLWAPGSRSWRPWPRG